MRLGLLTPFDMLSGYERKVKTAAAARPAGQLPRAAGGGGSTATAAAGSRSADAGAGLSGAAPKGRKIVARDTGSDSELEDLEEAAAVGILTHGSPDAVGRSGKRLAKIVAETTRKMAAAVNGRSTTQLMEHSMLPQPVSILPCAACFQVGHSRRACAPETWRMHVSMSSRPCRPPTKIANTACMCLPA